MYLNEQDPSLPSGSDIVGSFQQEQVKKKKKNQESRTIVIDVKV